MMNVIKKLKNGEPSADRKNYLIEVGAARLRGEALSHFASTAMAWGNDQEPVAKSRYEAITGRIIQPAPFVTHPLLPFFGATPDGYFEDGGLIEIKCPFNSAVHVATMLSGTIPPEHIPQVQAQMSVTAQMWCDFVSFDPRMPEGLDMFIVRVERSGAKVSRARKGRSSIPVISLTIETLAALYAGFQPAHQLRLIDRLEGSDEAVAIAGAIFGGQSPAMGEGF